MSALPRRDFLKAGGALVVGFNLSAALFGQSHLDPVSKAPVPGPPDAKLIDTWLAIHADNTATIFIGFAELGQGNSTALLQVAAEELDMDMSQLKTVRLDTSITPNQGGTYSSASIQRGGPQVRTAAAEARFVLLQLASKNLGAPVESLTVSKGAVSASGKSVTYGELTGDKPLHISFTGPFTGSAPLKPFTQYRLVGTGIPRNDIPDKVAGKYVYMQHVRVPDMLHGRVVRPRGQRNYGAGAKVLDIDESSIRAIRGARVLRKGDFVGVVAENEWDAVRAAQQLKVVFENVAALPGTAGLHEKMRASNTADKAVLERGDPGAFGGAAHVVSLNVRGPYQAHAPFGPNCAIGNVTADSALVMCSTQDVYATRTNIARITGLPPEKCRVQYYEGSGTYGHSCYDDVAQAAAILSQLAGRPVRLQFMRWDEHGWDNYGPPHVGEVRAAVDASGKLVAYEYHGWQHNWSLVETSEQLALGRPAAEWPGSAAQGLSAAHLGGIYDVPNVRLMNHQVPGAGLLKGAWLRSPLDLSVAFGSEQAIDELARLSGIDPYLFRRQNIKDPRWLGVLDAAAKAANWQPRVAASNLSRAKIVTGRGIGLGTHLVSHGGAVAEIEVNRETGVVVAKHLYGAIDAGQVVNPAFVENQIGGQLVQTASRMFKEEVTFNETGVTSLDWNSYPILRFEECPEVTGVVVQHLDQRSTGAGEEVMAAAAGAIANAFFDATGVRMKEFPFTPKRVLAALA
jgi:CO/xanthine dehydrogenase Mo-binding subunit